MNHNNKREKEKICEMQNTRNKGKVRFAPSLSGPLHLGSVLSLMYNFWYARSQGYELLWRVDSWNATSSDIERVRSNLRLAFLMGIRPSKIFFKRDKARYYQPFMKALTAYLYPCFQTQEELRGLDPKSLKRARLEGRGAGAQHLRLDLASLFGSRVYFWKDSAFGRCSFDSASSADPVVARADGSLTYVLSSVLADLREGVTTVIRGSDLLNTSAIHHAICWRLGARVDYAHHGLLVLPSGAKLSKSAGFEPSFNPMALVLKSGFLPASIRRWCASIGPRSWNEKQPFSLACVSPSVKIAEAAAIVSFLKTDFRKASLTEAREHPLFPLLDEQEWAVLRFNSTSVSEATWWADRLSCASVPAFSPCGKEDFRAFCKVLRTIVWGRTPSPSLLWALRRLPGELLSSRLADGFEAVELGLVKAGN